jgi:N-succinyldiaminopimelate aminotransferase
MLDKIAERISSMNTSIFATMSKLSNEHNAVNLGQGFPDFDGPLSLMEEAFNSMKSGKNQYAPSPGIFSLRKQISDVQRKYYGMDYDPETEITITAGATEALYCAISAFINPADEVILFEPYYDAYQADVVLAGGIPRYITLKKPDFKFDKNDLQNAITSKTKMILINSPHNPTGKVFDRSELEIIAKIAKDNNLIVVSDEAYEFLTYNQVKHIPIATLPGMRNRTITINSTGKTFGMTGWKIGYASASPILTNAIRKVHQWTTFAVNTPMQHAVAFGFENLDEYLPDFIKTYQYKRDLALNLLNDTNFKPHEPNGSYFIMVDIPDGVFVDDVDAATRLVREYGVATIPPSVFYSRSDEGKTMLRICFAKSDKTLIDGIAKLKLI